MRFEVAQSFFDKIYTFSKEPYSSIAQMTKQSSNFISFMTMIYRKNIMFFSIWIRLLIAYQTFIVLFFDHLFILFKINAVSSIKRVRFLISSKTLFMQRILSNFLVSNVMTFFAYIKMAIFIKIFMKFGIYFKNVTKFTGFEFIVHNTGI